MAIVSGGSGTTAVITGNATYQAVGNYSFQLTAFDGTTDTYGQKITAPAGAPSADAVTFSPVGVSGSVSVIS
jgi:hypothetical protein